MDNNFSTEHSNPDAKSVQKSDSVGFIIAISVIFGVVFGIPLLLLIGYKARNLYSQRKARLKSERLERSDIEDPPEPSPSTTFPPDNVDYQSETASSFIHIDSIKTPEEENLPSYKDV